MKRECPDRHGGLEEMPALYRLWMPSRESVLLRALAREYHARTEAHDRRVCTGPIMHGPIMPAGAEERRLINAHARRTFDELDEKAAALGFSRDQWHDAVCSAVSGSPVRG